MSEPPPPVPEGRGGPQVIPRPGAWRLGPGAPWGRPEADRPRQISVAQVEKALAWRGDPPAEAADEVPLIALPGAARPPAAVLCLLFDWDSQCHVVLTRRSSRLRSHTHQVSFPGGRLDPGEEAAHAALREAQEEVGIDPASVEIVGRLSPMRTVVNPSPITPFVAVTGTRPPLAPNPSEVERAFDVPLVELLDPGVYREELWTFPDGSERSMAFFELIGDTVWGATARMLVELLDLVVAYLVV
ncbi:MAG: CoA pyrophosphatase [Actinomycetota bacterium]|nr:CoA pyrophosphatase [Actinomycetota bacterium]